MVTGLEQFKTHFVGFEDMYTLIGGVACGLLMDDAGLDFRATKDFDIVLIVEALDEAFGRALWDFIKSGGYQIREKSSGVPEFYRFTHPTVADYPKEIELFSRKSHVLNYAEDDRLTPIHISDEISSLSAILLNDDYYEFLVSGLITIDGIRTLNYTHLIPFKAKAWLDLKARKDSGESVDSKNIEKHKRDVFRLSQLITEDDHVNMGVSIRNDMVLFIEQMGNENIVLKDIGVSGSKEDILALLKQVYLSTEEVFV